MVLVNCSPLLRSVLEPLAGESRSVIILPKEITKVDLEYLMEYVYLGSVSVPADRLEGVTKAADFLKIHGIPPLTNKVPLSHAGESSGPAGFNLDRLQFELATKNTTLRVVTSSGESVQLTVEERDQKSPTRKISKRKSPAPKKVSQKDDDDQIAGLFFVCVRRTLFKSADYNQH